MQPHSSLCHSGAVTPWRENATQQTQDDLDHLLNVVLPFAAQSLSAHGEFLPFGAVVTTEGETTLISADLGRERPLSTEVLDELYAGAIRDRGTIRAAAFVADFRTVSGDAIRVELEASEGVSLQVLQPYSRHWLTRRLTLGDLRLGSGEHRMWLPPSS